ncbi:unnamed protein product [Prorocentrum cordatum]|uniref:Uncharacterized protein n=1 Tax=Prorocentrum cordatum TaxID=2364126 RepID=A0ABN9VIZ8_9DINO|nr:unnamed protein product [Polarella glacialis]
MQRFFPQYLPPAPSYTAPAQAHPGKTQCCNQAFDAHVKQLPLKLYSSRHGMVEVCCIERHYSKCGTFYMGRWSYQRSSADLGDIRKLCLTPEGCPEPYFVGFSSAHGRHCVGLAAEDMRRVRPVLHHARGSFTTVAEMLIEESG